jgi:hypothetical protein
MNRREPKPSTPKCATYHTSSFRTSSLVNGFASRELAEKRVNTSTSLFSFSTTNATPRLSYLPTIFTFQYSASYWQSMLVLLLDTQCSRSPGVSALMANAQHGLLVICGCSYIYPILTIIHALAHTIMCWSFIRVSIISAYPKFPIRLFACSKGTDIQ